MSNYRNLSIAPPLTITAYFLYFSERQPQLRMDYPDFSPREITNRLKLDWSNLPDEQKQIFRDRSAIEKEKWLQRCAMMHTV